MPRGPLGATATATRSSGPRNNRHISLGDAGSSSSKESFSYFMIGSQGTNSL